MEARLDNARHHVRQALCDRNASQHGAAMAIIVASAVMNREMKSGLGGDWVADILGDELIVTVIGPGAGTAKLRFHIPDMTEELGAVYAVHDL